MKISIFVLHLGFGGIEKYAITIANLLAEYHDVELIATYKIVEVPSFPIADNIKITYLLMNKKPNAKEFKAAIRKKNLIAIMKEALHALRLLFHKRKSNIKAIKNCTSDVIISTRDYHNTLMQRYANQNIVKVTSEHNHHNNNKRYIKKVVKSCSKFDYMLPISKELVAFYKGRLPNVDVRYIPFCIDKPRDICKSTSKEPTFINVGRLSPEKGSVELIEAFAKIQNQLQDAHLHVVGDGVLMNQVKQKVLELNLENNITIHGFLYKEEIDVLYGQSDLFLMTSETESFGFVLLEAMVCGVPCIAYDSAQGARTIIENNKNGFLISDRNRDRYAEQVVEYCNHDEVHAQFAKEARITACEYDESITRAGWHSLMQEIESGRGGNQKA